MPDRPSQPMMPSVILETERLRLRAFVDSDIDDVYLIQADPDSQRWVPLPWPGAPYTRADAERWCRENGPALRTSGGGQHWAATERDTGRLVGAFGLLRTDWQAMATELGYTLAPWARGLGYATEAAVAVSLWAIDQGFQRVELKAATANTASRRVAERSGFTFEGIERSAIPLHSGRADLACYSLIPADLER